MIFTSGMKQCSKTNTIIKNNSQNRNSDAQLEMNDGAVYF